MSVRPDVGLEQLIHSLEQELLAAPDEEFVAGARDLGMNPDMKGSAAFVGVKGYLSAQVLNALRLANLARNGSGSGDHDPDGGPEASAERPGGSKRNLDA